MEGGKGGWTDWEGHHKVEEREVEREVRGVEWRKRLSEEREKGSVIQGHSGLAFLVVALWPLPHLLTGLPSSIHVNTIIPSALCSHFHITALPWYATSHLSFTSFTSESSLMFHFYLLTCVFVSSAFFNHFSPIPRRSVNTSVLPRLEPSRWWDP